MSPQFYLLWLPNLKLADLKLWWARTAEGIMCFWTQKLGKRGIRVALPMVGLRTKYTDGVSTYRLISKKRFLVVIILVSYYY